MMKYSVKTRVLVQNGKASHGLTGKIVEIDGKRLPYRVKFDEPCDGVASMWFDEAEIVALKKES